MSNLFSKICLTNYVPRQNTSERLRDLGGQLYERNWFTFGLPGYSKMCQA